jgi:dihydrofolate synthase / folylpolyglutamate synthase
MACRVGGEHMERDAESVRRHLFSLSSRGIKYDLDRMLSAIEACGNPQKAYSCFHVAGTNGKGSVCSYLESCLRCCGFKTGLFTSPHLVRFEERFMINGIPVDEPLWLRVYRDLQAKIDRFRLTFFEASTLIAFEIFKREKVGWAVFETGLGGRFDATNVVVPAVSVITRVAMDHMEYLGNDCASIAGEKLGIAKRGVPLIMFEPEDAGIKTLAVKHCEKTGAPCRFVNKSGETGCIADADGASFRFDGNNYRINLPGEFQVDNALLALAALKAAGLSGENPGAIAEGLSHAWLPGRFQTTEVRGRPVVFDVGHNPDAARAFCLSLRERFKTQSICLILGIMKDKDIAGMMAHYVTVAWRIICTAPATDRAAAPETIKNMVPETFNNGLSVASTVAAAVEAALASPEEVICIAGSFFTVGEAMRYLNVNPYVQ